jgi:hypothetical protein
MFWDLELNIWPFRTHATNFCDLFSFSAVTPYLRLGEPVEARFVSGYHKRDLAPALVSISVIAAM